MEMLGEPKQYAGSAGQGSRNKPQVLQKPSRGHYTDYFEKIETYVSLIAREVSLIEPTVTAFTFGVVSPRMRIIRSVISTRLRHAPR